MTLGELEEAIKAGKIDINITEADMEYVKAQAKEAMNGFYSAFNKMIEEEEL